jgi:hypothetical protein
MKKCCPRSGVALCQHHYSDLMYDGSEAHAEAAKMLARCKVKGFDCHKKPEEQKK